LNTDTPAAKRSSAPSEDQAGQVEGQHQDTQLDDRVKAGVAHHFCDRTECADGCQPEDSAQNAENQLL
jgi:hypothetical protein